MNNSSILLNRVQGRYRGSCCTEENEPGHNAPEKKEVGMNNKKVLLAGIGIIAVLSIIVIVRIKSLKTHTANAKLVALVSVEYPKPMTLKRTISLTGSIMAIQQASIFARVGGYLEKIPVDIGDKVRKGQVLAVINYQDLQNQYDQAKANFEYAGIQYERAKKLIAKQLIAQNDLDTAKTQYDVTLALKNLAALNLSYATITAPFSGYIANRYVDPGVLIPGSTQMVPATPLLVLVDISTVKIMVNIPERDVENIQAGMPVTAVADAYNDKVFKGTITRAAAALDPATRTLAVEVDIPNPQHLLKPGMFSRVNIVTEEHKNVLAVPVSALLSMDGTKNLYVIKNGIADFVPVEEGIESEGMVEIKKGISQSDAVVVQGEETLHEGENVTVQQAGKETM